MSSSLVDNNALRCYWQLPWMCKVRWYYFKHVLLKKLFKRHLPVCMKLNISFHNYHDILQSCDSWTLSRSHNGRYWCSYAHIPTSFLFQWCSLSAPLWHISSLCLDQKLLWKNLSLHSWNLSQMVFWKQILINT